MDPARRAAPPFQRIAARQLLPPCPRRRSPQQTERKTPPRPPHRHAPGRVRFLSLAETGVALRQDPPGCACRRAKGLADRGPMRVDRPDASPEPARAQPYLTLARSRLLKLT